MDFHHYPLFFCCIVFKPLLLYWSKQFYRNENIDMEKMPYGKRQHSQSFVSGERSGLMVLTPNTK